MGKKWQVSMKIIGWLLLVAIFFILIFPSFCDYRARAQMSEAISLASSAKKDVIEFYERYGHCPNDNDLLDTVIEGVYVESVYLKTLANSDGCYIVASLRQDSKVDRRVREKSLMFVMIPAASWQSKVTCKTNLKTNLVGC